MFSQADGENSPSESSRLRILVSRIMFIFFSPLVALLLAVEADRYLRLSYASWLHIKHFATQTSCTRLWASCSIPVGAVCALVSREFCAPALDIMWRDVDHLTLLFKILTCLEDRVTDPIVAQISGFRGEEYVSASVCFLSLVCR